MVTLRKMDSLFQELGYKLDRAGDCYGTSTNMTGPRAGTTFPEITTGLKEMDSGLSAFHFQARRDHNYRRMQELRMKVFAIVKGRIFTA